ESAEAEYHWSRRPGSSRAMRCGGMRAASIAAAARAVRPVWRSYSRPSWTTSSGSATPAAAPAGDHSVTSTVARSGRLRPRSGRRGPPAGGGAAVAPAAAGPLDDVGGAPDVARLPGRGAGGDMAADGTSAHRLPAPMGLAYTRSAGRQTWRADRPTVRRHVHRRGRSQWLT